MGCTSTPCIRNFLGKGLRLLRGLGSNHISGALGAHLDHPELRPPQDGARGPEPPKIPLYMWNSQLSRENFSQTQFSATEFSVQSQFSECLKKTIIMRIHENNAYWLGTMDQEADYVWMMTLNCLGCINTYSQ